MGIFGSLARGIKKISQIVVFTAASILSLGLIPYAKIASDEKHDIWPYKQNSKKEYILTRNFLGGQARPIRPDGTRLYFRPFVKIRTDDDGKPITVSAKRTEAEDKIQFRRGALQGELDIQYEYRPLNANRFFRTNAASPEQIGNTIHDLILTRLEKMSKEEKDGQNGEGEDGYYERIPEVLDSLKKELRKRNKDNPIWVKYGAVIDDINLSNITYDQASQDILSRERRATEDAKARIIQENAEAQAVVISAEAQKIALEAYMQNALVVAQAAGYEPRTKEFKEAVLQEYQRQRNLDGWDQIAGKPNLTSVAFLGNQNQYIPGVTLPNQPQERNLEQITEGAGI